MSKTTTTKLYWAGSKDDEHWNGPFASVEDAKRDATEEIPFGPIWVAPVDAEKDDDEKFWATIATRLLWKMDFVEESLIEEGWIDPEDGWERGGTDPHGILARALVGVLGPRPEWRQVDTAKAERVEL